MTDHRCHPHASSSPSTEPDINGGTFACVDCGWPLGEWVEGTIYMRRDLHERPIPHDGFPAYALPDRTRARGKTPRHDAGIRRAIVAEASIPVDKAGTHLRLPLQVPARDVYVVCPNPACAKGQHVRIPEW